MEPNLDQQITNLQRQANRLTSEIMAEGKGITSPRKRQRQAQKAEITQQIGILTEKRDLQKETEAFGKINDLFRNSNRAIIVEVNGMRQTPDKDFNIELRFSCHKHTKKINIREMLSYQKSVKNPSVLLAKWSAILNAQTTLATSFSCDQCKQAKAKKLSMFRRHSPFDLQGTASMSLQVV